MSTCDQVKIICADTASLVHAQILILQQQANSVQSSIDDETNDSITAMRDRQTDVDSFRKQQLMDILNGKTPLANVTLDSIKAKKLSEMQAILTSLNSKIVTLEAIVGDL